jgi:hypothetical protein
LIICLRWKDLESGRVLMDGEAEDSREAWLKAVERFSKILEEQLEQARARPDSGEEIRDIEQIQLKLLTLWRKQVRRPRETSKAEGKTRWIRREFEKAPQESSVDQAG